MKYRRKSDGFIIDIPLMDFFMGICPVNYMKLIDEWEEIKEEKPMHNFKVGDRVAFYDCIRIKGTIKEDLGHKFVIVEDRKNMEQENARYYHVHYKQCRKLKKRERRRVWIRPFDIKCMRSHNVNDIEGSIDKLCDDWVEFVEARKK